MKKTLLFVVLAVLCLNFNIKAQDRIILSGKIADQQNQPLPGVTIKIKNSNIAGITNSNGTFNISSVKKQGTLVVSFLGYNTTEINFNGRTSNLQIQLSESQNDLNEVQVIGYGQTTRRLNTGSVSTITSKQIEQQPVTNVLSALSGRMPGVVLQTTNGLPGGNINIQIRGKGSLAAGNNPLYIVDGVPFESATFGYALTTSAVNGVISPLNSLNPADIESINILKDADATSIYGSRGSNGVVLITTKKGKQGAVKGRINFSSGINTSANSPKMLKTDDYLQIRKEAYANDKLTPTLTNGPDLLVWQQDKYTDWGKYLFNNNARTTDLQTSVSGGNQQTIFNLSAGFHQEGNVISDQAKYLRGALSMSASHKSADQKFEISISNSLSADGNNSPNLENAANAIRLAPNFPLTDTNGEFTVSASNPLKDLQATAKAQTSNMLTNVNLSYLIFKDLRLKISGGYNKISIDQQKIFPLRSLFTGPNNAQYLQSSNQSVIAEPQLTYSKEFARSALTILAGGTFQNRETMAQSIKVSGFSSEELMENLSSAATIDARANTYTRYKYVSIFSRAIYSMFQKYILNATVRRDGSTRFGEGNQFGNFGSLGAAWLFGEENFMKQAGSILSFGKLRASYGITGNDQIPDYQFLSTYGSSGRTYQGITTLKPSRIDNASFHWETTAKMELALELGLLKNRILFNVSYYRNRSKDQLVQYALPTSTGFGAYQANIPATIENAGLEADFTTRNIERSKFSWTTQFNITIPRNKLISFENFETSGYAQTLEIGYDISRIKGYHFLGVDSQTGKGLYADADGNPATNVNAYFSNYTIGKTTPECYGGMGNTFTYGKLSLDVFLQFSVQKSTGGITSSPGQFSNTYAYAVRRWREPGMETDVPKASTLSDFYYVNSSANFFDASYLRLKNVVLNYSLPLSISKLLKAERIDVFLTGQNLLTFWDRNNPLNDPESGALNAVQPNIAPGKTLVAGLNFTF